MADDGTGGDRLELETRIDTAAAEAHALLLACDAEMFKSYEDGLAVMAIIRSVADHAAHARGLYERMAATRQNEDELCVVGVD
jgi:hypothetical protein